MTTNPYGAPWQETIKPPPPPPQEEEIDIDLTDPEVQKAAAMIRGKFKGFKLKKKPAPIKVGGATDLTKGQTKVRSLVMPQC